MRQAGGNSAATRRAISAADILVRCREATGATRLAMCVRARFGCRSERSGVGEVRCGLGDVHVIADMFGYFTDEGYVDHTPG